MDRIMIELRGISRRYRLHGQTVAALDGVDLDVGAGELLAITGASGSGKSTLLNVLGCLDRPDNGHYRLDGEDVAGLDDDAVSAVRNRRIGFVFQSFHLLPRLDVLENVLLPLRFFGELAQGQREAHEARAAELLRRVGLGDRLRHRPQALSGGQMQRVAIARALLMRPALLLADEPTGNLDSRSAAEVVELLRELNADGQTALIVTHDPALAEALPRQVRLRDGKVEHDHVH
jgi:putative ABC transport system ATP-binding protein